MPEVISDAIGDFVWGLKLAPLWMTLGWDQTLARFRRTILGPFWLSANLFAISFSLSVVFGGLMGVDYRVTFATIVSGVLTWSLIGGALGESSMLFVSASGMMMGQKLPLSFHVFLAMYRIFINFVCQLLALWIVFLILRLGSVPSWQLVFGLPIVLWTMSMMALLLAFPATRYRDFGQLIGAAMQLLFFITPVIWSPASVNSRQRKLMEYNPLSHLLAIVRDPLLGRAPTLHDWVWSGLTLIIATVLTILTLALYRKRVIFWI